MIEVALNKETLGRGELTLYDVIADGRKKGVIYRSLTHADPQSFCGNRRRDSGIITGVTRQHAIDFVCARP